MGDESDYLVNQQIKDFVFDLHDATRRSRMADDIRRLYTVEFKDLSDKYCDKAPWPSAKAVGNQCIGDDGQPDAYFLTIYTELVYRHMFAKLKTTLRDRLDAWTNYCEMFNYVLAATDAGTELTAQWVFDALHEFVYQFQSFCQYRTQNAGRSPEERAVLEANDAAWAAPTVLRYLARLRAVGGAGAPSALHRHCGVFAAVSLNRVECLLGDYGAAVAALDGLDVFDESAEHSKIFSCRLNLLYHLGYSLMMLFRYRDALRVFDGVLAQLARLHKHGGFQRFPAADQVQKSYDRMLALFAACSSLAPGHQPDDGVAAAIRDKYGDKMAMMDRGDAATFDAMLTYASPKHVVPAVPDYGVPANSSHDAYRQQIRRFNAEVAARGDLTTLRSYLKLYSSIDVAKLARFNDETVAEFRARLVGAKAKMRQADARPVGAETSAPASAADFHFYVCGDMVHVDEPPKTSHHDEFFTGQMKKYDAMIGHLKKLKPIIPKDDPKNKAKADSVDRD